MQNTVPSKQNRENIFTYIPPPHELPDIIYTEPECTHYGNSHIKMLPLHHFISEELETEPLADNIKSSRADNIYATKLINNYIKMQISAGKLVYERIYPNSVR